MLTSSPAGCAGTPVLSQSCACVRHLPYHPAVKRQAHVSQHPHDMRRLPWHGLQLNSREFSHARKWNDQHRDYAGMESDIAHLLELVPRIKELVNRQQVQH